MHVGCGSVGGEQSCCFRLERLSAPPLKQGGRAEVKKMQRARTFVKGVNATQANSVTSDTASKGRWCMRVHPHKSRGLSGLYCMTATRHRGGGRGQGLSVPPLDTEMPASGAATLVTEIRLAPGDDEEAQAAILLAHTEERTHGI